MKKRRNALIALIAVIAVLAAVAAALPAMKRLPASIETPAPVQGADSSSGSTADPIQPSDIIAGNTAAPATGTAEKPTPVFTPRPAAENTPEPTPEPSPSPTPEPSPSPTPKPSPSSTPKPSPSPTPKPSPSPTPAEKPTVKKLMEIARSRLGCPYSTGGKGPDSFDCSGFVYWCFNKAGAVLPYMTSGAWGSYTGHERISSPKELKEGDVFVVPGHVGIVAEATEAYTRLIDARLGNGGVGYTYIIWDVNGMLMLDEDGYWMWSCFMDSGIYDYSGFTGGYRIIR